MPRPAAPGTPAASRRSPAPLRPAVRAGSARRHPGPGAPPPVAARMDRPTRPPTRRAGGRVTAQGRSARREPGCPRPRASADQRAGSTQRRGRGTTTTGRPAPPRHRAPRPPGRRRPGPAGRQARRTGPRRRWVRRRRTPRAPPLRSQCCAASEASSSGGCSPPIRGARSARIRNPTSSAPRGPRTSPTATTESRSSTPRRYGRAASNCCGPDSRSRGGADGGTGAPDRRASAMRRPSRPPSPSDTPAERSGDDCASCRSWGKPRCRKACGRRRGAGMRRRDPPGRRWWTPGAWPIPP